MDKTPEETNSTPEVEVETSAVETNTEAVEMSDEEARVKMLQVAELTITAFSKLSQLTAEEMLEVFAGNKDPETYLEIINSIFKDYVAAELPQVYNEFTQNIGVRVVEKTFSGLKTKHDDNVAALIQHVTGVPYNDLSPKKVIETIEKIEEAVK